MNGIEFRDGLPIRIVVTLRRERALTDVNDHERNIHAAFDHLRDIHLRRQAHGVVALCREVRRIDIVVRIELDDAIVNQFHWNVTIPAWLQSMELE